MLDVNRSIGQLPSRHQSALRWFMDHRDEERTWPGSMPDGTLLVSKAKGIYKPSWTNYALSVRQSLGGPYSDRDPEIRSDGTWTYHYYQENPDPSQRDSQYTNRGMVDCPAFPSGCSWAVCGTVSLWVFYNRSRGSHRLHTKSLD